MTWRQRFDLECRDWPNYSVTLTGPYRIRSWPEMRINEIAQILLERVRDHDLVVERAMDGVVREYTGSRMREICQSWLRYEV